jgi:hypothetical protein
LLNDTATYLIGDLSPEYQLQTVTYDMQCVQRDYSTGELSESGPVRTTKRRVSITSLPLPWDIPLSTEAGPRMCRFPFEVRAVHDPLEEEEKEKEGKGQAGATSSPGGSSRLRDVPDLAGCTGVNLFVGTYPRQGMWNRFKEQFTVDSSSLDLLTPGWSFAHLDIVVEFVKRVLTLAHYHQTAIGGSHILSKEKRSKYDAAVLQCVLTKNKHARWNHRIRLSYRPKQPGPSNPVQC